MDVVCVHCRDALRADEKKRKHQAKLAAHLKRKAEEEEDKDKDGKSGGGDGSGSKQNKKAPSLEAGSSGGGAAANEKREAGMRTPNTAFDKNSKEGDGPGRQGTGSYACDREDAGHPGVGRPMLS